MAKIIATARRVSAIKGLPVRTVYITQTVTGAPTYTPNRDMAQRFASKAKADAALKIAARKLKLTPGNLLTA